MLKILRNNMKNTSKGVSKLKKKNCATTLYANYRASFSHLLRMIPTLSSLFEK